MGSTVAFSRAHGVNFQRVFHDEPEVGRFGDVIEGAVDARGQSGGREAAADDEFEIGTQLAQRVGDRRGLRQMAETVAGDVDEKARQGGVECVRLESAAV